jgi:hypothetical protein
MRRRRGCLRRTAVCPRGWQQPEDANPVLLRGRRLTVMLVWLRRWFCPCEGGDRPLPGPVGQQPATKALHEVGALAQPPAGREVWLRVSARWAACSSAQAATGAATVTSASWCGRRLVVVRISCLRSLATTGRDGEVALGLSQQQVEQHGAHDRGDHREQDHQHTARPTAQRADLHSSRSHGWLLGLQVAHRSPLALVR